MNTYIFSIENPLVKTIENKPMLVLDTQVFSDLQNQILTIPTNSKERTSFKSTRTDKSISNSDDDSLSDSYSVHDSPDTDSLGSDENSDENNGLRDEPQLQTDQNKINMSGIVSLNKENYYAIMYDTNWYLGRLIYFTNQEKTFCAIKFLKTDLDTFYWPKHPEQQEVNVKYIFYGPINLQGFGPFTI